MSDQRGSSVDLGFQSRTSETSGIMKTENIPPDADGSTTLDHPLTKQQQALWIEHRLHPNNTSYNTCVKLKLTGELDAMRFRKSSQIIVDFFDSLKIHFVEKDGVPFQRTELNGRYIPGFIDISNGNMPESDEKARRARDLMSEQLNTPIDLKTFPIVRGLLIKTAPDVHYFIGMVPHIISDGRAAILFLESLSIAYNKGEQGLIESYGGSRKTWDNYYDEGLHKLDPDFEQQSKAHWQERLKGANHYFDYSYGKQQLNANDKRGERVYFDLSTELSKRLKAHSKGNRTTLFNVFVCVFSIFVQRYYGLSDVLIGYPVNIRPRAYKNFFAFFVNIVPMRINMRGDPSYGELLSRVHETRKEDKKYQSYPALDIVSSIRETVQDFDGRVFNLSMAQTVSRLFDLQLDGINSEPLESEYYEVNDDFSLSYELIDGRIGLWFEYRQALFDRRFINQAMEHIEQIIHQALDYPDRPISQFTLLDQHHERQLISQFCRSADTAIEDKSTNSEDTDSITSLFQAQVERTPDAIAITMNNDPAHNTTITYRQLNDKANRLTNVLLQQTKGRPVAIAVSLERGIDLITSLIAILKAGCFYIPVPTNYPIARTKFILEESKATVLIRSSEQREFAGCDIFHLLSDQLHTCAGAQHKGQPIDNPEIDIRPNSRAYVIYTSGSTGKPKGVVLRHNNVTPRLKWLRKYFNLSQQDRMLQNTDFSFDVSVAEIFWPLISGASLIIADQGKSRDPAYLLRLIAQHRITTGCMVPALLNMLLDADKSAQLKYMKQILAAGEVLPRSVVTKFYSCLDARLFNFYGPTEAAIYATFTQCQRDNDITIGKPLGDTTIYILDEDGNIQPTGVVGEMYIGGRGIADGYLGNTELSGQCFVNDPFVTGSSAIMYRTGDLARFDFDGNIDFIGRKDRQVKIRGFRVELGEIENCILKSHGVGDAAVIDRQRDDAHTQLVAYIARENAITIADKQRSDIPSDIPSNEELIDTARRQICATLPGYMMPSMFIILDQIPRSLAGKLDRTNLPRPESMLARGEHFQPARTNMEKSLSHIWGTVLGITASNLDVNTSFFELGGDSLMAIQFVSLAEQQQILFDIGDIFELRSIAELATVARIGAASRCDQSEIAGNYPLLPRQAKFFADDFVNKDHWNRTFIFDIKHKLDCNALIKSLDAVIHHHDNLRVSFVQQLDGRWRQELQSGLSASNIFTQYDLLDKPGAEQVAAMVKLTNLHHRKIKLLDAPLMQLIHFRTGPIQGQLTILLHHLLLDMVSSRIIFEDLLRAYEAYRAGIALILPAKTDSVKDWANYLNDSLQTHDFSETLAYWGSFPNHAIPRLPVIDEPGCTPGRHYQRKLESNAVLEIFKLGPESTQQLLTRLPKIAAIPIQDFLLASLFKAISDWTSSKAMTVSICGHGRPLNIETINLTRTVGWINTVFPIYLSMADSDNGNEIDFLTKVQKQISQVPPNNMEYNLLRYSDKHPEMARHLSPEIFFNYVGQLDTYIPESAAFIPRAELPGIESVDGSNHLCYQLYFEAGVIEGQLTFRLTFSDKIFSRQSINKLTAELLATIERNISVLNL